MSRCGYAGKRVFDVVLAVFVGAITAPIWVLATVAVVISSGRPALFRQARVGRNDTEFTLLKFRTMREPRHGESRFTTDGNRVTRVGRFLRSTSIDELPQLVNVLKGEMSVVGPRPLLPQYLPLYTNEQRRRHSVRPGVTGLAQVEGRSGLPFSKRFVLDVQYVDNASFRLDTVILARTLLSVLRREGAGLGGFDGIDDFGAETAVSGDPTC